MANLVITSATDYVDVVFNDYSIVGYIKASFRRSAITQIYLKTDYVQVVMTNGEMWGVSLLGASSTMIVDTVDTIVPSSLTDLYEKIRALIKS